MFTLVRSVIIIGIIFYFSPVRDRKESAKPVSGGHGATLAEASQGEGEAANEILTSVVGGITQEVARAAVNDFARTAIKDKTKEAGLRLKEHVAWSEPTQRPPVTAPSTTNRDMANKASHSVRCVYRCDGTE